MFSDREAQRRWRGFLQKLWIDKAVIDNYFRLSQTFKTTNCHETRVARSCAYEIDRVYLHIVLSSSV
jgi:hypothetical protein